MATNVPKHSILSLNVPECPVFSICVRGSLVWVGRSEGVLVVFDGMDMGAAFLLSDEKSVVPLYL
jgi:hypothetical protein